MITGTTNIAAKENAAGASDAAVDKRLWGAAQKLEQMFLNMFLSEVNKNVGKDSLLYAGTAEDMFRRELNNEYAKKISEGRGVGIAKIVYEQWMRKGVKSPALPPEIDADRALQAARFADLGIITPSETASGAE